MPEDLLWAYALNCLARRDYGTRELRERLLRPRPGKPAPSEEDADRAIARLQELGLLDDERRAERLAESLRRKGYGVNRVRMELRQRGLPEPEEPPGDEPGTIARLLETKYAARLGDERGRRAAFQALLRRGFRSADVSLAFKEYMDERVELNHQDDFDAWESDCEWR